MTASTARGLGSSALSSPGFVGRDVELASVLAALDRDDPVMVLVEGEAGIGKTRLVQELLGAHEGALLVACPPYSQPFTLGPVIDALRDAVDDVRRLSLSPLAGALRPVFPEWAGHLPPSPERLDDPAASQHRLFRALAELIDALDVELLAIEDAHWADPATLDLLLFLSSRPAAGRRLALTYRPSEVVSGSALHRLTARPGATTTRVSLEGLGVEDTALLVSSMLQDRPVTDAFAEFLHARTEGVPLALEETVRLLHDRADLTRRDGEWVRRHLDQIEVPPTVRDGVLERFQRLSVETQVVLRAAAIFGAAVDEPTVTAISGLSSEAVRDGLSEALAALILEARGVDVQFRHVLVGQAIYDAVSAPELRQGHRVAGEILERRTPTPYARLATHFRMAGDVPRWCQYAEQAADLATETGDEATSVSLLFEVVLNAGVDTTELARLADKITYSATVGAGRHEALIDVLHHALAGGEPEPHVRGLLRFQLARALSNAGRYIESRSEVESAIPDLADPKMALRAMLMLGPPFGTDWPASRHLEWVERAREAEPSEDSSDRTRALVGRAFALLKLGEPSGWEAVECIPRASTDSQERDHLARGQVNLSDVAMVWGRYDVALQSLERAEQLARGRSYLRVDDLVRLNRARLDWFTGSWDGLSERVAQLANDEDIPAHTRLEPLLVAIGLQCAAGPAGPAGARLEDAWERAQTYPIDAITVETGSQLASWYLIDRRFDDALRVSAVALAMVRRKELWLWASDLAPVRVSALLAVGQREEAVALADEFATGIRGRHIPVADAALATCLAMLAEGDRDQATSSAYALACGRWDQLPRPYVALLVRERWARYELANGAHKLGLTRLSAVFDGLADLGARVDATRVLDTLGEFGVERRRPWLGGRTSYGDRLSPRELEVVRLVARGGTNREVAEELFRSPHTVSSQLSSAMRKLGVTSRRDLVVPQE